MGEFSTPLSSLIRSSKQKQNREIATNTLQRKKKLTKVMNQMNLIDNCTKYIYLTPQGIFSKNKYMLLKKVYYLFCVYEYIVAVFRHTRRGH